WIFSWLPAKAPAAVVYESISILGKPHLCEEFARDTRIGNIGMGLLRTESQKPRFEIVHEREQAFLKGTFYVYFIQCDANQNRNLQRTAKTDVTPYLELHYRHDESFARRLQDLHLNETFVRVSLQQMGLIDGNPFFVGEVFIPMTTQGNTYGLLGSKDLAAYLNGNNVTKKLHLKFATEWDFGSNGRRLHARSSAFEFTINLKKD
ncbi:MAG: hypothetical protein OM95_16830, partial [Bdellovibrio sp. ArHS]|uniref:hypothetical protein n=1 Tax=Bdellovibrio sp. ArHS TaxID=1569284 RepID=UPI0005824CC0